MIIKSDKIITPNGLSDGYLITDGECTVRINEKIYICRKNDLILIPANIKMDFLEMFLM